MLQVGQVNVAQQKLTRALADLAIKEDSMHKKASEAEAAKRARSRQDNKVKTEEKEVILAKIAEVRHRKVEQNVAFTHVCVRTRRKRKRSMSRQRRMQEKLIKKKQKARQ